MHDSPWLLAIDQGTQASRALLLDTRGRVVFQARRPVALRRLDNERVEQDAAELIGTVREVVSAALAHAAASQREIAAAGLATQRSTVVAWDAVSGRPLHAALSWQDTRAQALLHGLRVEGDAIARRTGLRISPHYGASKLRWLLDEVPAVRTAATEGRLCLGPLAAFLLFHLLEGRPFRCDAVNAARTLLCDLDRRDWDTALLARFGLQREWLPECRPVVDDYGQLRDSAIPLRAVTGDQNAALCAAGEPAPREALVNIGTGAFVVAPLGETAQRAPPLLTSLVWSSARDARYLLEGTVNGAGAALSWASERWDLPPPQQALAPWPECSAEQPLFLNTVGGLGSPWWRSGIDPRWLGARAEASPACQTAAVAESVLFLIQANLDAMSAASVPVAGLRVGGGLAQLDGLCQRLADLSGLPVHRAQETEATARGIAWLAAGRPAHWASPQATHFAAQPAPQLRQRYTRFCCALQELIAS